MYVYVRSESALWTVGFYDPAGKWITESDHASKVAAAARVHYLNGRDSTADPEMLAALMQARKAMNYAGITGDPAQFMVDAAIAKSKGE